jgi:hypothetical protein
MASDVRYSTTVHNGFLDTLNTRLGSNAKLRIYSGTKPATADAALSGNTVLAELLLTTPSPFGSAASRVLTAAAIATDLTADATGTATFASFLTSGNTRVLDVTVGEAADSADITVNTKSFVAGAEVEITAFSITHNL